MKTELEQIEKMSPAKLFKPKFMPTLLKAIEVEVTSQVPDVETPDGRKAITSLAYKVARSKTTIDDLGKGFVAEQKQAIAAVDEVRKLSRDFLDNLKATVRAPLTRWEDTEQLRVEKIQGKINQIIDLGDITDDIGKLLPSIALESNLADLRKVKVTKAYAEWQDDAINKLNAAIVAVMDAVPIAKAAEREAVDARVAAEKLQEEQRIENEQRIAREAVEASEGEAKRELEQIQETAATEAAEQEARDNDVKHKRRIHREALETMLKVNPSCDEVLAKQIIKSIVAGKIDHIKITY